jgi:hypothetical protein
MSLISAVPVRSAGSAPELSPEPESRIPDSYRLFCDFLFARASSACSSHKNPRVRYKESNPGPSSRISGGHNATTGLKILQSADIPCTSYCHSPLLSRNPGPNGYLGDAPGTIPEIHVPLPLRHDKPSQAKLDFSEVVDNFRIHSITLPTICYNAAAGPRLGQGVPKVSRPVFRPPPGRARFEIPRGKMPIILESA